MIYNKHDLDEWFKIKVKFLNPLFHKQKILKKMEYKIIY